MARPKKYNIVLTDDELKKLKSVMRKKQTTKTVRNRCQIIIDLDEAHGKVLTHEQSAKTNCVCMATITNTVKLYSEKGIQAIITLNQHLLEMPVSCIEYVVLHEFCHFLYPNHSKDFYAILSTLMPDWQQRKKLLDKNAQFEWSQKYETFCGGES